MPEWVHIMITIFTSVLASSGLWSYLMKKAEKKDVRSRMLVGLAHDRIICLGMKYIERGWITQEEYENLNDYLYKPYEEMGGNGSAKKVMEEVRRLPLRKIDIKMEGDAYKC